MFSMGKRALIAPLAPALKFPVVAHLSLILVFILFDKLSKFILSFLLLMRILFSVEFVVVVSAVGSKVFVTGGLQRGLSRIK